MKNIFTTLFVVLSYAALSQNVAINATGAAPAASAMLDITSTTSGLLIPRMTTAQRTAIVLPATGLKVYDTTTGTFWYHNGTLWVEILNGKMGWTTIGNAGTNPTTNFLGTTDNQSLVFRTNNTERMRINGSNGHVGIGINAPLYPLHLVTSLHEMARFVSTGFNDPQVVVQNNAGNLALVGVRSAGGFFQHQAGASIRIETNGGGLGTLYAGNAGIGTTAPAASAILDITSTTRGLLIPRMTTAQRTAILAPATGLKVYDTTTGTFWYHNGTIWVQLLNANTGWSLNGNTVAAANFMGSTNAVAVRFFCNNIERFRLNPTDGEFVAGAAATPYAGDMIGAVTNAVLTFGINGYSGQNGSGVWGETLAANTTNFSAVQGVYGGSGQGAGVLGNYNGTNTSNTRAGVFGLCSQAAANTAGVGVSGLNNIASGNQRMGVLGQYNGAAFGIGVYGIGFGGGILAGNNDVAVVGWRANNANFSGYFNGNHVIANGTKSGSVPTSKGNQLLYTTESPEVWFEDIGSGKLVNGEATIALDPLFIETVVIDDKHPMHVFVQMEGESNDVYVIKDKTSFKVKERNHGTSNAEFSYKIMAKRVHFQDHRFGNDPVWGPGDTKKYSQYANPPAIDYYENVRLIEDQKKNWKQTPMPEGFIYYEQLQREAKQYELTKKAKGEK